MEQVALSAVGSWDEEMVLTGAGEGCSSQLESTLSTSLITHAYVPSRIHREGANEQKTSPPSGCLGSPWFWFFSLTAIHILLCSDPFTNSLNRHNSKWIDPGLWTADDWQIYVALPTCKKACQVEWDGKLGFQRACGHLGNEMCPWDHHTGCIP